MDIVNEFFQFYKLWSKFGRNHKSVQSVKFYAKGPGGRQGYGSINGQMTSCLFCYDSAALPMLN